MAFDRSSRILGPGSSSAIALSKEEEKSPEVRLIETWREGARDVEGEADEACRTRSRNVFRSAYYRHQRVYEHDRK